MISAQRIVMFLLIFSHVSGPLAFAIAASETLAPLSIFNSVLPAETQKALESLLNKLKRSKQYKQRREIAFSIFKTFFPRKDQHSQAVLNQLFHSLKDSNHNGIQDSLYYVIGRALEHNRELKVTHEQFDSLLDILRAKDSWPRDDELIPEEQYLTIAISCALRNSPSLKVSEDALHTLFSVLEKMNFLDLRRKDLKDALDIALANEPDIVMSVDSFHTYLGRIENLSAFPDIQWRRMQVVSIAMANDEHLVSTYRDWLAVVSNTELRQLLVRCIPLAVLANPRISPTLAELIKTEFGLSWISFAEQGSYGAGAARNKGSLFAQTLLSNIIHVRLKPLPAPAPRMEDVRVRLYAKEIKDILPNHTFVRAYSRKLLFRSPEGKLIVLRFMSAWARNGQELLDYESRMMDYLHTHRTALGLKGVYPHSVPLGGERIASIHHLPKKLVNALKKTGSSVHESYLVSAYAVDYMDFFTRLNDPKLSPKVFREAASTNIHDLFVLARYGLIHTVPIPLFHNLEIHQRADRGRFLSMVDIFNPNEGVNVGVGRLNAWTQAVHGANMGAQGLTDYEEIWPLDLLIDEKTLDSPAAHLHILDNDHPSYNKKIFFLANYLSEYMLSWALVVSSYLRERDELDWQKPEVLARFLAEGFDTGYRAFTELPEDNAVPASPVVSFQRLARQIGFFLALKQPYAPYMLGEKLPKEIFDLDPAKIHFPEDGVEHARNWKQLADGPGASADGVHPDIGFWNSAFWLQELVTAWHVYAAFMMAEISGPTPRSPTLSASWNTEITPLPERSL